MGEKTLEVLEKFPKDRLFLLAIFRKVKESEGHISAESLREISRYLSLSENDVYSVATFYRQIRSWLQQT